MVLPHFYGNVSIPHHSWSISIACSLPSLLGNTLSLRSETTGLLHLIFVYSCPLLLCVLNTWMRSSGICLPCDLFYLTWSLSVPSMVSQKAGLHFFLWLSSISLCILTTYSSFFPEEKRYSWKYLVFVSDSVLGDHTWRLWGPYGGAGDWTEVGHMQGKCPIHSIFPWTPRPHLLDHSAIDQLVIFIYWL